MAIFEKLRISLAREDLGPLLKDAKYEEKFMGRRDFLIAAFSEERDFYRGKRETKLTFTPLPLPEEKVFENYIAGHFKRLKPTALANKNLTKYLAPHYESAFVMISISKDQITWIQKNINIGATKNLLQFYLDDVIRRTDIKDWKPYVKYIDSERSYWNTIEEKSPEITEISFTFIPPNALGLEDVISEILEEMKSEGGVEIQQHTHKSKQGKMNPKAKLMKESANIILNGGGDARVYGVKRILLYKTGRSPVSKDMPREEIPTFESSSSTRRFIEKLFET